MTNALRTLYKWWALILVAGVVVQIGAAGYGAFYAADKSDPGPMTEKQFDHGFDFHSGFGYIVLYAAIVLFLVALAARIGRRAVLFALGAPLLVIVQILLAAAGEGAAWAGVFHPVFAFIVLGYIGSLAGRVWRGQRIPPRAEAAS
jgi:hypothetical protein